MLRLVPHALGKERENAMIDKAPTRRRRRRRKPDPKTIKNTATENLANTLPDPDEEAKGKGATCPNATAPGADSESTSTTESLKTNWDNEPRRGYFGGRAGPGRPKNTEQGEVGEEGEDSQGEGDVDLLAAFNRAIRVHGVKRFWRDLLKKSPVSAAQLLACLRKTDASGHGPKADVHLIFPEGMAELPIPTNAKPGDDVEPQQSDPEPDPDDELDEPESVEDEPARPAQPEPERDGTWTVIEDFGDTKTAAFLPENDDDMWS